MISMMGSLRRVLRLAAMVAPLALSPSAHANVVWEDYQGQNNILGSSNHDKPGPNYDNSTGSGAVRIAALAAIAATPSNATRTGNSATIDYLQASQTLCDLSADTAGTGSACQADAMGRVIYALVKFPEAGSYTLAAAWDDEMKVDLSSNYTNTSYHTVSYDLPVTTRSCCTGNDNSFTNVGTVNAPEANSCALIRVYWNNNINQAYLRLRWTKPSTTVEIIPASQLFDPGIAASSSGCVGSVGRAGTAITLNKSIAGSGRVAAADQFTVAIANDASGTTAASATTSGSGTGQQASTGAFAAGVNTVYRMTDAMASGSTDTIASYVPTIACTRNGTSFTPGGAAPTWTTSAAANELVVCTITNTRQPPIAVAKSVVPIYDPVNGVTNPKFIPGAGIDYTIAISNPGAPASADSVVIVDPLPTITSLYVGDLSGSAGSGPVVFTDGAPSSTLTYTYSGLSSTTDDVDFSNDGGATWTYVPVPGSNGCDPLITALRIRPKGAMPQGGSFTTRFRLAMQ